MTDQEFLERSAEFRRKYQAAFGERKESRHTRDLTTKNRIVLASAVLAPFTGGLSLLAGAAAEIHHRSNYDQDGKYRH